MQCRCDFITLLGHIRARRRDRDRVPTNFIMFSSSCDVLVDCVRLLSAEMNVVSAMNAFGNSGERIPMCSRLVCLR